MKKWIFLICFPLLFSCSKSTKPKLVIVISVDQMRGDYFDLFNHQFEAGLKEIQNGKVYSNTHHYHSKTVTAAGHATLLTGCYPSTHGIVNNNVYNRTEKRWHYSIEDTSIHFIGNPDSELPKVSALRLKRPSLGDIVKTADESGKVFSVAIKDRASILMGGSSCDRAYWFDSKATKMVSTDFYIDEYPDWVNTYTAQSVVGDDLEKGWYPESNFEPVDAFTSSDTLAQEKDCFYSYFPHTQSSFHRESAKENPIGNMMLYTPFGDKYVLEFAKQLIAREQLGQDQHPDVLTVGLSNADIIGHHFGPNSHEVLDYYNKLDFFLQDFIDYLNETVGKDNYLLVLSSDHGVNPIPEALDKKGNSKRISHAQFDHDIALLSNDIQQQFKLSKSIIEDASYNGIEPNLTEAISKGIDSFTIVQAITERFRELPYVREAYSLYDLEEDKCEKPYLDYVRHSYMPNYGYFIRFIPEEYYLVDFRDHGTTHGTPYTYDTHVPMVFYGLSAESRNPSANKKTYTVDMVPTILDCIGIKTDFTFDGKVLP